MSQVGALHMIVAIDLLFDNTNLDSDSLLVEKENLLCVFKLVIKDLLDTSLRGERLLEKEHFPLKHFFMVLEQILFHGYNGKKSFPIGSSSTRKDLWPLIDLISRKSTDIQSSEISISSKEMTNIRTSLGRVRAWLRLALMQKRLADYFKILLEQKQELKEFYDSDALLVSDENVIITGLLVGLNVLDFNFCLKETALDYPTESMIRYSLYLRERRTSSTRNTTDDHSSNLLDENSNEFDVDGSSASLPLSSSSSSSSSSTTQSNHEALIMSHTTDNISIDGTQPHTFKDQRLTKILDQKNYLEELNRNLRFVHVYIVVYRSVPSMVIVVEQRH
jgi:hypothetical protein